MEIVIKRKKFRKQKYHCRIVHDNGNILFWSENQANLKDLEEMIANFQKNISKAKITYDFDVPDKPE